MVYCRFSVVVDDELPTTQDIVALCLDSTPLR
jgi:hypothetical protein